MSVLQFTNTNVCLKAYTYYDSYWGSFDALINLIESSNGTLTLNQSYLYNDAYDANYVNGIEINKNLTINGNGYVINGSNIARIFHITSNATVVLNNLSLVDGASQEGGLIYNEGDLTINNSNFVNDGNSTSRYIYSDNTVVINNSQFEVLVDLVNNTGDISFGEVKTILVVINDGCEIPGKSSKNVVLNFNNVQFSGTTNTEDKVNITASNLASGDYTVTVATITSGTNTFIGNDSLTFKVNKKNPHMNVTVKQDKDTAQFTLVLPAGATGTLTLFVNGIQQWNGPVEHSTSIFNITNLPGGQVTIGFKYSGDDNYGNQSSETILTVYKAELQAPELVKTYGNNSNLVITLLVNGERKANEYVSVKINNETSTIKTNRNGQILISKNMIGFYNITATYNGDYGSASVNTNLTILTSIIAEGFSIVYNDGSEFVATFYNLDGSLSANKQHYFYIEGGRYTVMTDSNGVARLKITEKPRDCHVDVKNSLNSEYKSFIVKIYKLSTELNVEANSPYYGVPISIGATITPEDPTGNINYVIYDANGYEVEHQIKAIGSNITVSALNVGNYYVIATYDGNDYYSGFSDRADFTVFKTDPVLTLTITNATYGKNVVIYSTITSGATVILIIVFV